MGLDNLHIIEANGVNDLVINPSSAGATNTGTMRAISGATLRLQDGTLDNTGGLIEAQDTSTVELSGVTVVGGELTSTGTGEVRGIGAVTLDASGGLTNSGLYAIANNQSTTAIGALTNTGTIRLDSTGANTNFIVGGSDLTLNGGGTISLSSDTSSRIYGVPNTVRLTNEDNLIEGAGELGDGRMGLVNRALVDANSTGSSLTIEPSSTTTVENSGTLQASNGGELILSGGTFDNFEGVTEGVIRADASNLTVAGGTVTGGVVTLLGASELKLQTGIVTGGVVANSATGSIRASSGLSVLGGVVTNPAGGQIVLDDGADLTLEASGTYQNSGSILVNGSASLTDLVMSGGDVTLTGGGTITLSEYIIISDCS